MKKSDYIKENGCANSVKGWVMILILFALLFFVFGCGNPYPKEKISEPIKTVIHDTVKVVEYQVGRLGIDSVVKDLLNNYYSVGWLDAVDALIGLHNAEKFDQKSINLKRWAACKKMEKEINNKLK